MAERLNALDATFLEHPSDAQLLPDGNVRVAGFNTPGRIDVLTPKGKVIWTYERSSGAGALDRPSLAVAFPSGKIAVTDDWHHRVVVIERRTKRIVWQYARRPRFNRGRRPFPIGQSPSDAQRDLIRATRST